MNKLENHINEIYSTMRSSGLFLTAGDNKRANTTNLCNAAFGMFWEKPVAVVPVSTRKYTLELIESTGTFTISVPRKDLMKELSRAGIISGRVCDKFSELHLHPSRARRVPGYIVGDCGLHLECSVIYKIHSDLHQLVGHPLTGYENPAHTHTVFYGEILDIYES